MAIQIMVVEDDNDIRELIGQSLRQADFQVHVCADAADAIRSIAAVEPDCLIVDWLLPDMSGVEFIRWVRRQPDFQHIPSLMLTARSQEADKITGLEAGADDYMTKPMSLRELHARVHALLRRPATYIESKDVVSAGDMQINIKTHEFFVREQLVELSRTEFKLLRFFLENQGKVFSRNQIIDSVWGLASWIDERTVDVHILRLRKKLKQQGVLQSIVTVRGAGYRFSKPAGQGSSE